MDSPLAAPALPAPSLDQAELVNPIARYTNCILVALAVLSTALWSILSLLNPANRGGDFYWSLVQGRWMLTHHAVLRRDLFSYTIFHHHVPLIEWGYNVLLAVAQRTVGATVLIFLIYVGVLVSSAYYLHLRGASSLRISVSMVMLAWFFTPYVAQGRALGLSLIYFPLLLIVIHRARTSPRLLLLLPPLFVLWVNTHGSFLLGIAVLAVEVIFSWLSQPVLHRPPPSSHRRALLLTLLASTPALLATPWGPDLLTHNLALASNAQIHRFFDEWQPVNLTNPRWFLLLVVLVALIVRALRHRAVLFDITLVTALTIAWIDANRLLPYTALAAIGLFVADPTPLVTRRWARMLTTTAAVGLLLAAGLALDRHQFSYTGVQKPMPSNAVRYLSTHHDTGRVLAFSDWGGYLMGYGYMSFVDGRVDLFTGPLLNAANTLAVTRNYNPDALLNHYRVSYVIWPDQLALTSDLIHDPHWTRVQDVGYISLFVRTSPNPYANVSGLISKGA